VCGYFGPQMLGALRDRTGGFAAGWYMMAGVAAATVCLIFLLSKFRKHPEDSSVRDAVTKAAVS
jgi:LPXTG-motif cell wall-anchored protein